MPLEIKEQDRVKSVNFGYNSVIFYAKTDKTLIVPPTIFDEKSERWHAFDAPGIRSTMEYELFGLRPPKKRHWMFSEDKAKEFIDGGLLIPNPKTGKPQYKLEASNQTLLDTDWTDLQEAGFFFNFPNGEKNVDLIKRIIKMICSSNDIILDAFAGSGTTMHAIMDLNKEDGGKRKCILVQMPEATQAAPKKNICKDITRERIKRAIDKYNYNSGFRYFRVGIPIDAETMLSGQLPTYKQFAEYVYYLCTGNGLPDKKSIDEKSYYVGTYDRNVIYLLYKQNFEALTKMPLNFDVAEQLIKTNPGKRIIVYAPACFLEDDYMKDHNIDFVGIPYNLFSRVSP